MTGSTDKAFAIMVEVFRFALVANLAGFRFFVAGFVI
jgi:hypothetical protein